MTEAIALKVELILVPKQLSSLIKFIFSLSKFSEVNFLQKDILKYFGKHKTVLVTLSADFKEETQPIEFSKVTASLRY